MSREVLSSRDYQYLDEGYLVDNLPWQEEIKKRLEEEAREKPVEVETNGTFELEDFKPLPLDTEMATEPPPPPEPTAEEVSLKAKEEAEEKAKSIERAARKNAFEIVEQSRWEANDIVTKAKEEAEKEVHLLKEAASETGRQEGLEKGRIEGFEKGKSEGQQTYSGLITKWDGLLKETTNERKKLLVEMKPILVDLLGEALHNCLKKEAKRHGQMVVEFVEEALKKAQDSVHLKLHLNPEDVEEVEAQKERLQLSVGIGELELVPDARVERGGCLLETEAGSVDVRLSTIVNQMTESLSSELSKG
jgi:flagellar assembly protein FliH